MRCLPTIKPFIVSKANLNNISFCDDQKRRELRIATDVACHTSVNAVDELSDITKDETRAFQIHRTKFSAVIKSVLAPYFRDELRQVIGNSHYPFTSTKQPTFLWTSYLCICIKYCLKKHTRFVNSYLGLVELLDADANGKVDAIIGFLHANMLDIANMVGIATDGASVMVGRQHSVYTLLKQKQPNLQLIRCVCHSLHIVAQKAMQQLPSNIEYMIRETYNWFAHSS